MSRGRATVRRVRAVLGRDRRTLLRTPLLDEAWISAQVGRPLTRRQAVDVYLGAPHDISPHPLFAEARPPARGRAAGEKTTRNPLIAYLSEPSRRPCPHPLLDADAFGASPSGEARSGSLVDWLGSATDASVLPFRPGLPRLTWGEFRRAATASAISGRPLVGSPTMGAAPIDGRTSLVLMIAAGESVGLLEWLEALDAGDDHDLEVIVVGRGLGVSDRVVADLTADQPGWTVVLVDASETASAAATAGGLAATGTRLVFASAASRASRSTVIGLGEAADVPGGALAVPVTAVRSDLVLTAGAGFFQSAVPAPLLRGHALADAEAVGRHEIPAPLGDVVAMSTTTFREAGGLEATLPMVWACADLALRSGSTTLLCPDLVALHYDARSLFGEAFAAGASAFARRWPFSPPRQMLTRDVVRRAGLDVVGVQNVPLSRPKRAAAMPKPDDEVVTTPRLVLASRSSLQVDEARPRLRWTIDLASPGGLKGDQWGDTHFGRSLAEALRRDGQHVAVDRRTVRHRESRDLDDVLLVLRGLDEPRPRVGVVNLEWIISHPDLVSAEEVSGFDRVYAASTSWSQERTRAWGIEIVPLLQCTDATLFRPGLAEPDSGPPVLFVGNSRGVYRSAVRGAIEGGVDLTLYGNGWDDILPEGTAAAAYVANHELGGLYASAGITLNDHWDDMRRDGFLSNRLFDAAACGARILTDPIAGVTDVLGALVREFTDASDLVRIVRQRESLYPPATQRLELAAHVVAEHSFDARARVLVDDAIELWRLRQR